jgi:hypothetical protein
MRRGLVILWAILAAFGTAVGIAAWWVFSPTHAYYIRDTGTEPVLLIADSSEVRHLIAREEAHAPEEVKVGEALLQQYEPLAVVERREHPERYFPEHIRFLDALTHQPHVTAPAGSYARLLEMSHAKCNSDPSLSGEYAKVRLTSGPMRGREGWLCYWRDLTPTILIDSSIPRFIQPGRECDGRFIAISESLSYRHAHRSFSASSDRSIAIRTNWLRVRTPVFSNSCCNVAFTELRDTPISYAISLFVSPSKTLRSTCCSRGVSAAPVTFAPGLATVNGAGGVAFWSIHTSPLATVRIA